MFVCLFIFLFVWQFFISKFACLCVDLLFICMFVCLFVFLLACLLGYCLLVSVFFPLFFFFVAFAGLSFCSSCQYLLGCVFVCIHVCFFVLNLAIGAVAIGNRELVEHERVEKTHVARYLLHALHGVLCHFFI